MDEADSEAQLVAGLRRGDRAAFGRAYALYHRRIYAFLARLSGRREVADDLAQETWVALGRAAPSLRADTDLTAWLYAVARNAFRSHRRWALLDFTRHVAFDESLAHDAPTASAAPDENAARGAEVAALEVALARLAPAEREVILLVAVDGLAHRQAAHILGISEDAARQRLRRARNNLHAHLRQATPRHAR